MALDAVSQADIPQMWRSFSQSVKKTTHRSSSIRGVSEGQLRSELTLHNSLARDLLGLGIGWAIYEDAEACYDFIARKFAPGDKIFLFGFSRGGLVARSVAAMLYAYGASNGAHSKFSHLATQSLCDLRHFGPRLTPPGPAVNSTTPRWAGEVWHP